MIETGVVGFFALYADYFSFVQTVLCRIYAGAGSFYPRHNPGIHLRACRPDDTVIRGSCFYSYQDNGAVLVPGRDRGHASCSSKSSTPAGSVRRGHGLSLKRETVKFSLITAVAVAGGFIFHILLARSFGISAQLDCLFVALTLFSWLTVLNMFVTSLYIPIFNELKESSPAQSLVFVDVTLKWTLFLSGAAVWTVFLLRCSDLQALGPGFDPARLALARQLSHILVFGLVFFSVSNTCVLTLNALYRYTVPATVDIFDPVLNILAIFFLVPRIGIKAIAFSYLVSNGAKMCILLWYLRGMTGWKPTKYFYHPQLKHLFKKSSQMTIGGFIWSLRDVLTRNITSRLGEGAVALYAYAEKIIIILVQLLVNPLVKVYYSRVSEWVAKSSWHHIRALFIRTSRVGISLSLFVASGLAVFLACCAAPVAGREQIRPAVDHQAFKGVRSAAGLFYHRRFRELSFPDHFCPETGRSGCGMRHRRGPGIVDDRGISFAFVRRVRPGVGYNPGPGVGQYLLLFLYPCSSACHCRGVVTDILQACRHRFCFFRGRKAALFLDESGYPFHPGIVADLGGGVFLDRENIS